MVRCVRRRPNAAVTTCTTVVPMGAAWGGRQLQLGAGWSCWSLGGGAGCLATTVIPRSGVAATRDLMCVPRGRATGTAHEIPRRWRSSG